MSLIAQVRNALTSIRMDVRLIGRGPAFAAALTLAATAIAPSAEAGSLRASSRNRHDAARVLPPTQPAGADEQVTAVKPTTPTASPPDAAASGPPAMTMAIFLDRLMVAESGGRDDARNPRSTATGPFQFIESTWLDLARRLFASETQAMGPVQILALRSDPAFARRAAEAYTKDNAAILQGSGIEPTFPRLRLAHLLGPQGAVRILRAPPQAPVATLLGPAATAANPFLSRLTSETLLARAARDLDVTPTTLAGVTVDGVTPTSARPQRPGLLVRCNLDLPACRHWKALALMRLPAKSARRQMALAR